MKGEAEMRRRLRILGTMSRTPAALFSALLLIMAVPLASACSDDAPGAESSSSSSGANLSSGGTGSSSSSSGSTGGTSSGASGQPEAGPPPGGPGPAPTRTCAQAKDAMGFFKLTSPKGDYVVRLPADYDVKAPKPYPMVVAMHGCGDTARSFAEWAATSYTGRPTQNYIAISIGGRDGQCWNLQADEAMVLGAIDDVRQCFYAHDRKIVLAGYSSGGLLAYQLGLKYANRFAGILVEPSSIPGRAALVAGASWKINVAATGGKFDTSFPPSVYNADWAALKGAGFPLQTQELDIDHNGTGDEWEKFLVPKMATWVAP